MVKKLEETVNTDKEKSAELLRSQKDELIQAQEQVKKLEKTVATDKEKSAEQLLAKETDLKKAQEQLKELQETVTAILANESTDANGSNKSS